MSNQILDKRGAGILLHPTSLPGPYGIGCLGESAFRFVDFLHRSKQKYWQVLPLGPTGYGHSPYASSSSFAGNPLLIDLDTMAEDLEMFDIPVNLDFGDQSFRVNFDAVLESKLPLLRKTARHFEEKATDQRRDEFVEFCRNQASWLDDYALFMAIKEHYDAIAAEKGEAAQTWNVAWDSAIACRDPEPLAKLAKELEHEVLVHKVLQFYFNRQWNAVKQYANERDILIIGDIPIFVALDSADVWSEPHLFQLDELRRPTVVAGVPPDYFSATGQRWGNPLYDWERMQADNFEWWMRRFESMRRLVDVVRIDHFRGFEAYWSIPVSCPTAVEGEWIKAPGNELFEEFNRRFADYPILAEDLGLITPEVDALRTDFGFPGMRVLQFAFAPFEPETNHFLPHHYEARTVVYTGTHDNDTSLGWFESQTPETQQVVREYAGGCTDNVAWALIRLAHSSVANLAIIPMQDVLSLGTEHRMNTPSTIGGNWSWRMEEHHIDEDVTQRLEHMTTLYGR